MSSPVATVTPETGVNDCCRVMEENQVRRLSMLDDGDACRAMVAQADVATSAPQQTAATVVQGVAQPGETASRGGGSSP